MTNPDHIKTFSLFCAPTALAGLMGCEPLEAAELLASVPGMAPEPQKGYVKNRAWHRFLEDLGLRRVDTEHPDGQARWKEEVATFTERQEDYFAGRRRTYPAAPSWVRARYPTVAQWLRANPTATGIVQVLGHTLYVRNGKVAADAQHTNSMRARIISAFLED